MNEIDKPSTADLDYKIEESDSESESGEISPTLPKSKKSTKRMNERTCYGTTYPADVWFHIAKYIPPEDLLKFALICKDTYRVLQSVQFWKQLSHR